LLVVAAYPSLHNNNQSVWQILGLGNGACMSLADLQIPQATATFQSTYKASFEG
jgi:hypothetical protein